MASFGIGTSLRRAFGALLKPPPGTAGAKKPPTLAYSLEEVPPPAVTWISAVQHVGMFAIFMVYPLIVARQADLPAEEIVNILQMGLLVLALGTLLQALPRGPVGSGFLAPSIFSGVYLAPSLLAVHAGGLPLVWGMTIFAGLLEMALSQVWSRLRAFIPPESAGLVVFLVGTIIGLAALQVLIEDNPSGVLSARDGIVAGCALATMCGLNIWSKGRPKLYCILIGMIVGYLVSIAVGLLGLRDLAEIMGRPLIAFPDFTHVAFAFDWSLVVPFAVSGLAAAMNSTAVLTTYQRLADADWVRPDMVSIGRGILADGIGTTIAGLFGTFGATVSSANVGLVVATGVTSRVIALAIAVILVVASLQPALIGVLTIMPPPVMAAAMLFTAAFIMISGVQIISSRVLDGRRTLVIGMGMLAFFAVAVYPSAFAGAPQWAQPLVTSPLVMATFAALLLNLLFRIGIRRKVEMTIEPGAEHADDISSFIERNAGIWGARRDVIKRLEFAVQQTIEAVIGFCEPKGAIRIGISYDEFVIDALVTYAGAPLEFPDKPPTQEEIIETEEGHRRLAGFLIKRFADRMRTAEDNRGTMVFLHFDH